MERISMKISQPVKAGGHSFPNKIYLFKKADFENLHTPRILHPWL
jgi:hypothetical protein